MINRSTFALAHSEGCMRLLGFLCITDAGCRGYNYLFQFSMLRLCQNLSMPWPQRFWLTGSEKYMYYSLNVTRQTNLMYQDLVLRSWQRLDQWRPEIRLRGPV